MFSSTSDMLKFVNEYKMRSEDFKIYIRKKRAHKLSKLTRI